MNEGNVFKSFTLLQAKNNLKRSPTLQYDNDIRNVINMKHTCLDIIQEPRFPIKPPSSVKIILKFMEPCSKKESKSTIRRKGTEMIFNLTKPRLVTAFTDGSSDTDCNRGGSSVIPTYPTGSTLKHRVPAEKITSNFTDSLQSG